MDFRIKIVAIPIVKRKVQNVKHKIPYNLNAYLKEILEVDVTEVFGISKISALTILSEVGADLTKWKTEHHFTSWSGLASKTKISGKIISSRTEGKKR